MRSLRVVGLAENGRDLVCDEPTTGNHFVLPYDERLRAAARGDLPRMGQLEIEVDPQLRPRDIQSRIRAGASLAEVAALAGVSELKVERYAHPVLLERSTMAGRARLARPAIDGISASASVEETVTATLAARGHTGSVAWDAFRDGPHWVLALTWQVGRSDNRAEWVFHPGPAGGTLTARDDAAAEIVDPALRVLRPLREVRGDMPQPQFLDPTLATEPPAARSSPVGRPSAGSGAARGQSPASRSIGASTSAGTRTEGSNSSQQRPAAARDVPTKPGSAMSSAGDGQSHGQSHPEAPSRMAGVPEGLAKAAPIAPSPEISSSPVGRTSVTADGVASAHVSAGGQGPAADVLGATRVSTAGVLGDGQLSGVARAEAERLVEETVRDERSGALPVATRAEVSRTGTESASARSPRRGGRPAMPSWEDVLLGTKSSDR